ncbi:MAG: cobalamin B12-binding domain protein [Deltaproteobacteria bacterium]|jgi:acyl-CoA synthetase (AMP-forming)/AMP-acid ligase II|nr:cobalamin B12-binding domain protein [Deltaproteobacteria bacterium]
MIKELPKEVLDLDEKILSYIRRGTDHQDSEGFNRLALRVFELQVKYIPIYRRYCEKRGITPEKISSWDQIPALPTDAFKVMELAMLPSSAVRTFMTSGTTKPEERGKVHYDEGGLRLMDATIYQAASSFLFPDKVKTTILVIAPSPEIVPTMVMAYGMNRLMEYFGSPQSRFLIGKEGFEMRVLVDELRRSEAEGFPITICGGSFGFVNVFDYCREKGSRFRLLPGSRTLDAGGFKGRSREVKREEFVSDCEDFLGVAKTHCVNLLGMTEISSQFYDNTLRNAFMGTNLPRGKINPPWTRTLVVNPDTLEPLPPGQTGLLRHFDLANRGHLLAIQSDDLGRITPEGFEIEGRTREGEARGCSLTIDEMTQIRKV